MTLESRIEKYLSLAKQPISRDLLLEKAEDAGYKKNQLYEALSALEEKVYIGAWYGTASGRTYGGEPEGKWYALYDMSDEEITSRQEDILWFSLL